jgi:hypothetical protein
MEHFVLSARLRLDFIAYLLFNLLMVIEKR